MHAGDHDHVSGAGREVGARNGPVRTRPNGPRMQTEGKKRSPHSGRARACRSSHAPFRASPIVAEKTRPQGCKPQDISERTARKAIKQGSPSLITKVFATPASII